MAKSKSITADIEEARNRIKEQFGSEEGRREFLEQYDSEEAYGKAKEQFAVAVAKQKEQIQKALELGNVFAAMEIYGELNYMAGLVEGFGLWMRDTMYGAKRRAGQQRQHDDKQSRVNLAHKLSAEYDPGDVKKRGHKAIHKEIGEIMQQRLELPRPIKPETLRDYLKEEKTGES